MWSRWGHIGGSLWTAGTCCCGLLWGLSTGTSLNCGKAIPRLWMTESRRWAGYGAAVGTARDRRRRDPVPAGDDSPVEVRRSARRRRTVTAYRDSDRTIVLIPARMSRAEERRWVAVMLDRLAAQERRRQPTDAELQDRAVELSQRYLDGLADPRTVRWVANQGSRWGSCTPSDRSIRLSNRLRGMPSWVIDYVLVHELAHLRAAGHGPDFWTLVDRYPRAQRARGYLEGVAAAAGISFTDDGGLGGLTGDEEDAGLPRRDGPASDRSGRERSGRERSARDAADGGAERAG